MKISRSCIFVALIFFSGCTMHPKYSRPETCMTNKWRFEISEDFSDINAHWWHQFNDPILNEYVNLALLNNQDIQVSIYRVQEFVAKLGIIKSEFYPQFKAKIGASRDKFSSTFFENNFTQDYINDYHLILNASFELDVWGKIRSASQKALAELLSQMQTQKVVIQTMISSLISAYIDLLKLDEQLVLSKKTCSDREESYYLASVRYELGLTSKIQVDQALSELDDAKTKTLEIEKEICLMEDLIAVLLGTAPTSIARGKNIEELILPESVSLCLPSKLLDQRPDILAAEQKLIAANANIGVAKAKFFPEISLLGAIGYQSSMLKSLFDASSNLWEYGVSIAQEIFTGGRLTSNLKLTQAQKMSMLHEYQKVVLNAFKEVNDALAKHQKALEIVKAQKEKIKALKDYLYLANLRYNDGLTDYLTYLDAERQYFRADLEYIQMQADTFLSLIEIYKSIGGQWVDILDQKLDEQKIK